jgi:hypothetical protein
VAATRGELGARERHADAVGSAVADEVQQRPPSASEIEDPPAGLDPDLLGDVLVLAALGLLEREREVAVVLRPREVRQLAEAEPEDLVGKRVGELEVAALGDPPTLAARDPRLLDLVTRKSADRRITRWH